MTKSEQRLIFQNKPERRNEVEAHPHSPKNPEPYVITEELKTAVNLALYLRRPLLLEGDAGCGKTCLASAIAYELGLPLYRWDVRSSTKAKDGLYEYDAILRLHDVQAQKNQLVSPALNEPSEQTDAEIQEENEKPRNPSNPRDYRMFGPLGKAFRLENCRGVVLIDEIDKADLDFPNDLLTVLEKPWRFTIKETRETIEALHEPIVIITSNKEKGNLPAPFLRRCLYFYVNFPNHPEQLQEIVDRHYQFAEESEPEKKLVESAVGRFLNLWNQGGLFKKPGTSEFLDWLKALHTFESEPYDAARLAKDELLPYRELLIKLQKDWKDYIKNPI